MAQSLFWLLEQSFLNRDFFSLNRSFINRELSALALNITQSLQFSTLDATILVCDLIVKTMAQSLLI